MPEAVSYLRQILAELVLLREQIVNLQTWITLNSPRRTEVPRTQAAKILDAVAVYNSERD